MIAVPPVPSGHAERVASLRAILEATEAVDSYCVDFLTREGVVDLDYLGAERVDHVMRVLAELDGIVAASEDLDEPLGLPDPMSTHTVKRAATLAAAIREAIAPRAVDQ